MAMVVFSVLHSDRIFRNSRLGEFGYRRYLRGSRAVYEVRGVGDRVGEHDVRRPDNSAGCTVLMWHPNPVKCQAEAERIVHCCRIE